MKLYHGSNKKIKGKSLIPNRPQDLGKKKENMVKGIYATSIKNNAIAMAIICSKGVISGSLDFEKTKKGIIYEGWPKQKYVYLYTLSNESFKKSSKNSTQFVSEKPVKPLKVEKINVEGYLHLVRKANKKESEEFKLLIKKK